MKKVYRTIATFDSKSKPGKVYTVKVDETGALSCDCPKWIFVKGEVRDCYHVRVVRSEMKNPRELEPFGRRQWVYDSVFGKTGTPKQFMSAKLSGAKRQFRLGLFVGVGFPYNITGNVEDYRLVNDKDVEIKISGKWYPKFMVSKHPTIIKAISRRRKNPASVHKSSPRKNSLIVPITAATITMQRMERERKEKEKKKSVGLRWNPKSLYEDFHGVSPVRKRPVYYEEPKGELIKIGRLVRIEYEPEPPSKLAGTRYTHEGGDLGHKVIKSNAILATNKEGTQLYIVREKKTKYPRFSGRGIEG